MLSSEGWLPGGAGTPLCPQPDPPLLPVEGLKGGLGQVCHDRGRLGASHLPLHLPCKGRTHTPSIPLHSPGDRAFISFSEQLGWCPRRGRDGGQGTANIRTPNQDPQAGSGASEVSLKSPQDPTTVTEEQREGWKNLNSRDSVLGDPNTSPVCPSSSLQSCGVVWEPSPSPWEAPGGTNSPRYSEKDKE